MGFVHANDAAMSDLGYDRRENDFYATPEWVTRAFVETLRGGELRGILDLPMWECACGDGRMARVLESYQAHVHASDLVDRGYGVTGTNFLETMKTPFGFVPCLIVTNPPYVEAEAFVRHALDLTKEDNGAVAMLLRHEWDCAVSRRDLFGPGSAFQAKVTLTSRPRWIEGTTGSPRHNYSWYIFDWQRTLQRPVILYGTKREIVQ